MWGQDPCHSGSASTVVIFLSLVGPDLNHTSMVLPISMWLFLYILSGRWSVQQVFSSFSETVVLHVVVEIGVSMVGGELRIFLLHHLNPKIILLLLKAVGKWLHNVIFPAEFPNSTSIWVWTHFWSSSVIKLKLNSAKQLYDIRVHI